MEKCKNIVSDHEDLSTMKPTEVITSGAAETQKSESSAILVAHFDGQAFHAVNVGNTGFMAKIHQKSLRKDWANCSSMMAK
ncbi:hypothetical protein HN51_028484 [Arachis hypogaea]